jgi:hypothetical protein
MARIVYGYKAVKPLTAWVKDAQFPDGHEVTYQPGDEVPAGEWKGAAVNAMLENGRLMRYALNVYEAGEFGGDAPPVAVGEPSLGLVSDGVSTSEVMEELRSLRRQIDLLSQRAAGPDDGAADLEADLAVVDGVFPRAEAGGMFVLSDGVRVKGKAKAIAAQAALDVAAEGL